MSPTEKQQLEQLLQRRHGLKKQFSAIPKTTNEFQRRKNSVGHHYLTLKHDNYSLKKNLEQTRNELHTIKTWLNKTRFDTKTNPKKKLSKKQKTKLIKLLNTENKQLRHLYQKLKTLDTRIAQNKASIGTGNFVSRHETMLQKNLLDTHQKKKLLVTTVLRHLTNSDKTRGDRLRKQRSRVITNFKHIRKLLRHIDHTVTIKMTNYKNLLKIKHHLLTKYRHQIKNFDRDSNRITKKISVPLFTKTHKQLTQVVLKTNLRLVNIT